MTPLAVGVFLHVLCAVFVTGYALFWVVMAVTLTREEANDARKLLGTVADARWPPVGPPKLRLPLPIVGWGILVAIALTGLLTASLYATRPLELLTGGSPWGTTMTVKLACFGVLLAGQTGVTIRPSVTVAYLTGAATMATLLVSAFLRH